MSTQVAAEDWTGAWHRLAIGKPRGVSYVGLSAVSCPSATECVAVGGGTSKKNGNWVPVAETWTRSGGWKADRLAVPAGNGNSMLSAISCPTASLCYAAGGAGSFATVVADQLPLVERWTPRGGWARVKLPVLRGSMENDLNGISCTSAKQCTAVGSYATTTKQYGLIEQLKGAAWTASTAPRSTDGVLDAVSCPTAGLCEAVGSLPGGRNLAERWSNGKWAPTEPPGPPSSGGLLELTAISCASATHCVATGDTLSTAFADTLNGTTWTKTAQYGPGFKIGELFAISCFSTSAKRVSCAAIGGTTSIDATSVPLSAFLTGSKWRVVSTV
jgi:hypothetical protein